MNSYRCVQCNLVNWTSQEFCKRCQSPNPYLNAPANVAEFSANTTQINNFAQTAQSVGVIPNYSTPPPPNVFGAGVGTTNVGSFAPVAPPAYINNPQPMQAFNAVNTICGMCGIQSNNMKNLYNDDVCKKCHRQYISRRQAAFLFDCLIYRGLVTILLIGLAKSVGDSIISFMLILSFFPIILKDATNGVSLGKWIAGLKTIDFTTKQPCGIGKSIVRNIILYVPLMLLIELVFIQNGKRLGDRIVNTRVIWNKYEKARVFWK